MPISRGEFEKGDIDLRLVILEFLRSNSDYAHSLEEIIEQLISEGITPIYEEVNDMLTGLVNKKRLESKSISGVLYYMYCKVVGFRPS